MDKYVVAINRQFGSMGRQIAREMSELLDIGYYDRDIVEQSAKKMNMPVSVVSDTEEMARNRFFNMKFPLGTGTTVVQDQLFEVQQNIILNIVDRESCIIVGRCSDYILRNHKRHISIFIYASYEQRLKNCIEILNMDERTARKMINEVDRARDSYHMHYAKCIPNDVQYTNIMLDSGLFGVTGSAKSLVEIVKSALIQITPF